MSDWGDTGWAADGHSHCETADDAAVSGHVETRVGIGGYDHAAVAGGLSSVGRPIG